MSSTKYRQFFRSYQYESYVIDIQQLLFSMMSKLMNYYIRLTKQALGDESTASSTDYMYKFYQRMTGIYHFRKLILISIDKQLFEDKPSNGMSMSVAWAWAWGPRINDYIKRTLAFPFMDYITGECGFLGDLIVIRSNGFSTSFIPYYSYSDDLNNGLLPNELYVHSHTERALRNVLYFTILCTFLSDLRTASYNFQASSGPALPTSRPTSNCCPRGLSNNGLECDCSTRCCKEAPPWVAETFDNFENILCKSSRTEQSLKTQHSWILHSIRWMMFRTWWIVLSVNYL